MGTRLFVWINRYFSGQFPIRTQLFKTLKSLDTKEKLVSHFDKQIELKDFIEHLRVALSVYKTQPDYPFSQIINRISPRFNIIQSQLLSCDHTDLSSLVYILKVSKEYKMTTLYSLRYERHLLLRIEQGLNNTIAQQTLMNLFRDLGLLNKLFKKIENMVTDRLKNPNQVFSVDDLRKILIATTNWNQHRLVVIEELAIEKFQTLNFLLFGNSELAECLKTLALVIKRRNIQDLLGQVLNSLALRNDFLKLKEIKQVMEFYTLTNKVGKGCLYDCLNRLEEIVNKETDIEIPEFLEAAKHFKNLIKAEPPTELNTRLICFFIDKTISLYESKQIPLIKTLETLSDFEELCTELPESIKSFIKVFKNNHVIGYWKLLHIKIMSKSFPLPEKVFENFERVKENLKTSSIFIKVRSLEKILQTRSFNTNPQLLELHQFLIEKIIENCDSWINIKKLALIFDSLQNIVARDELKRILEKCLFVLRNSSEQESWIVIHIFLNFFVEGREFKNLWKESWLVVSKKLMSSAITNAVTNFHEAGKVEAAFLMMESINGNVEGQIASCTSLCSENFDGIDLEIAAKIVFNAGFGFLLHKNFKFSESGLLVYLLKNSENFGFFQYFAKIEDFAQQVRVNIEDHQELIKFLSWANKLTPTLLVQIKTQLKNLEGTSKYNELINEFSKVPGILNIFSEEIVNFLQNSPNITIKDLSNRLFAYLNMPFDLPHEDEFLSFITLTLFCPENKPEFQSTLISLTKTLTSHKVFKHRLLTEISKFILKDFNSYPLYILLEIFTQILQTHQFDPLILSDFEKNIFSHNLSPSLSVKLIKSYTKCKRFNPHFNKLCQTLKPSWALPHLKTLEDAYRDGESTSEELLKLLLSIEGKDN